jgi:hypothetical protein
MGRILNHLSGRGLKRRLSRPVCFAVASLAAAGCLGAQTVPFTGPVEAFTFDPPAAGFRAIQGRLGAAQLGPSLARGFEYGSVAPQRDYALGFGRGRATLVTGLASGQPVSTELAGSFSTPEKVVWSADGSLGVAFSSSGNWIQTFTGFAALASGNGPGSVAANSPLNLASLGGALTTVATDARGQRTFFGIASQAGSGGVYELTGGNFVPVWSTAGPLSLAVSVDGGTLYVLDGPSRQVTLLNLSTWAAQPWPIAELTDPFAIRAAVDASQRPVLYIAGRGDQQVIAYDPATEQPIVSLPLAARPDEIEPLGSSSFVLRSRLSAQDPLWSLTSAPTTAVYFVPGTSPENRPASLREGRGR